MYYEFKEEKPFFAEINWSNKRKWSYVKIPVEDVGGPNGIKLILEYAAHQNVRLEYLEYRDHVKFYVAGKEFVSSEAVVKLANELYKDIDAMSPASISNSALKMRYPKVSYSKYKKAIEHLKREGMIKEVSIREGRGRPSLEFIAIK